MESRRRNSCVVLWRRGEAKGDMAGKVGKNSSMKRILQEVMELEDEASKPNKMFLAKPLESDLFEWHFSVRGPPETAFAGGVYHGRIILPADYPFKVRKSNELLGVCSIVVGRLCASPLNDERTWVHFCQYLNRPQKLSS